MDNVIVSARVISQLIYFIKRADAMGLERDGLESLKQDMRTIQGMLTDDVASSSNYIQNVGVKIKRDLHGVAYEIADLLDELSLMIVKQKSVYQGSLLKKVYSFIPSLSPSCSRSTSFNPRESSHFAFKIKEFTSIYGPAIRALLEEITSLRGRYMFGYFDDLRTENGRETNSLPELNVFGRENDKISLLNYLLTENSKQVEVISIVGVFGSGKTTMAKSLYNDDSVRQHFHVQGWMYVSNVYDEASIASQLLFSLRTENAEKLELEHLEKHFYGKRVLLVLDDVWTEDVLKWEPFKNSLGNTSPGSKILVTTRSERVANASCSGFVHKLGPLSNSDCWLFLKSILWWDNSTEIPKEMVKIGKKIAKNCKGSPVTVKMVGDTMMTRQNTPQEWQRVVDTGIWKMKEVETSLLSLYYMTYRELSPESNLCLWDCAIFPRDHVINVDQIIRLWMAQGYFGYDADDKVIEQKAVWCFNELVNHCFFQDLAKESIHKDKITRCKIERAAHDLIISMVSRGCGDRKLRSSLSFSGSQIPKDLFVSDMKHLKSLVLSSCHLEQLPSEAEGLSLLQYLDLSYNPLKELPETIYKLYSLQFLDVGFCYLLSRLPHRIGEVTNLKHLRVNGTTDELHNFPPGFEKLTFIRTLDVFRIGGKYDSNVQKLKDLNQVEDIRIAVHGKVHFPNADLKRKFQMESLELCFVGDGRDPEKAQCIEELVPPPNLKLLKIEDYPGLRLPKWILSYSTITKLRRLSVRSASNITSLPSFWKLSCLEFLWLYDFPSMKRLGREFFGYPKTVQPLSLKKEKRTWGHLIGKDDMESSDESDDSEDGEEISEDDDAAFPCLKTLRIEYMQNWITWEDVDEAHEKRIKVMPSLEELIIADCPKFQGKPFCILRDTPWFKKQHHGQTDDNPSTSRGNASEIENHIHELHHTIDQIDNKPSTSKGKACEIEPVQD